MKITRREVLGMLQMISRQGGLKHYAVSPADAKAIYQFSVKGNESLKDFLEFVESKSETKVVEGQQVKQVVEDAQDEAEKMANEEIEIDFRLKLSDTCVVPTTALEPVIYLGLLD